MYMASCKSVKIVSTQTCDVCESQLRTALQSSSLTSSASRPRPTGPARLRGRGRTKSMSQSADSSEPWFQQRKCPSVYVSLNLPEHSTVRECGEMSVLTILLT